jgi:hypothetical protein
MYLIFLLKEIQKMKIRKELVRVRVEKKEIELTIVVVICFVRTVIVVTLRIICRTVFFIGRKIFTLMATRLKHYIKEAYQFSKKNNLFVIYEIYFYFGCNFMLCCYLEIIGIDKLQIIKILVKFTTSNNF